jgi:hypothetical protein
MPARLVARLAARLATLMAVAAPAIACGDSRPVTLLSVLPLGWGSKLVLLFVASEDEGRGAAFDFARGLPVEIASLGWREMRRDATGDCADLRVGAEAWECSWRGRKMGEERTC